MMRAIAAHEITPDLSGLILTRCPVPKPGPGQLLVRLEAAALNPVDWKLATGAFPGLTLPHVLGLDGVGVIAAVGPGVDGRMVGQRVVWHGNLQEPGVFAEHALAWAHVVSLVPDAVEPLAAAAVPCAGYTAFQGLVRKARVVAGETVLVQGAAGGVGGFALQVAKAFGATVIALARPEAADRLKALGADHVLDHRDPELVRQVRALTPGGDGVDIMVEVANPGDARRSLDLIRYNGQLVSIDPLPDLSRTPAYTYAASLHEVALGGAYAAGHRPSQDDLARIGDWFMAGLAGRRLDPLIARTITLEAVPEALRQLRAGGIGGKIVVRI